MPSKIALIDFHKCDPAKCNAGKCPAVEVCPRKLIKQEQPYETPMTDPFVCRGCADCVRACPLGAIKIVTQ